MTQSEIIDKVRSSSKIEDVISVINFKNEYNAILKEIHPDVCGVSGASEATAKMNHWKDIFENGQEYKDDLGIFSSNGYWVKFSSTDDNMKWSLENYRILTGFSGTPHDLFKKYIPSEGLLASNGGVTFNLRKRSIPIVGQALAQEHVNWILGRLFEYAAYLQEWNMVHCGFVPESVFITPEDHGIQIVSFYHMAGIGKKIKTISGKYQSWYPPSVFKEKIATPSIDISMIKSIGAYLLGDKSGVGVRLSKTHNPAFIKFLTSGGDDNSYKAMVKYKQMLKDNFKKEFHSLTI